MKPDFIQSEIDRIAAIPGACEEALTLLALAKEAQQTGTMPDLQSLLPEPHQPQTPKA